MVILSIRSGPKAKYHKKNLGLKSPNLDANKISLRKKEKETTWKLSWKCSDPKLTQSIKKN